MNEIIFAIYKRKLKYPSEIKISERIVPCCVLWFLTANPCKQYTGVILRLDLNSFGVIQTQIYL